jgi:hypothetical protein
VIMSNTRPMSYPPDRKMRAYLRLVRSTILQMRDSSCWGSRQDEFVRDLGMAMHNITDLMGDYQDGWLSEAQFRKTYLRPFDSKWSDHNGGGKGLEALLDEFLESDW